MSHLWGFWYGTVYICAIYSYSARIIIGNVRPRKSSDDLTMQRQPRRVFPLSRSIHFEHFRCYYPFGNTPAEDFLQSISVSECRRPTILSLGCGDIRSCIYTIWKNFGFKGENSNGFSGVNFVLNDCSASILARNIMFLYLCMCMPDDEVSRKEWIASMWSLWYNHELQPQHVTMLSDALAQLVQWSHTWQEWSECPLGGVVQFSSPATFASVKMIWSRWNSPMTQSVDEMKMARNAFHTYNLTTCYGCETREEGMKAITKREFKMSLLKSIHIFERIDTMEKEYLHYLMEGTVWAESVLGIPSSTLKTVVNPTLIERQDGMYSLGYALTPYVGFMQNVQYLCTEICRTLVKESTFLQFLPVADHHFRDVPLLANSVQQFAMWLVGTAHMIRKTSQTVSGDKVSFVFNLDDAMNLCHFVHHQPEVFSESLVRIAKFDAIYTSNLFDHLSPPALVLSALPLLKPDGTLFTCTFEHITQTSREYLETMFGFSPELFPALLGIHCLGEDGEYSSPVNNEPRPNYVFTYYKTFLWRNIKSQSLIIDTIEVSPQATMSLLRLYDISCLHALMHVGCVESFLIILHQFLKQLQSSCASSHHFLKFLSTAIRMEAQFKPHHLQLQTQSLLHGVHMHITLTEDTCPLCRGQPLESYLQQFTVSFDITAKAQVYDAPSFSINLVSFTGDVALVTSVACRSSGPTLALDFFLPKQCLSQYSMFSVNMLRNRQQEVVIAGSMYDLVSSETEYIFLKPNIQPCATEKHRYVCPLGSIVKHIGDESHFETLVSMNDACLMEMKMSKMSIKLTEPNQLKLCCGALSTTVVYPYAVNESKTHIKVLNNILSITVEREGSVFYNEKPSFYVDPSNKLALTRFQCHADVMDMYCNLQMPQSSPDHPLLNVRNYFTELFKNALCGEKYFTLFVPSKCVVSTPDIYALVYVHDVRFSTTFSSPVLDVSYCFLDTKPLHLTPDFIAMHNHLNPCRTIMVDDMDYKLLKKIFNYFSTVTCCAFSADRHTVKLPIEKHTLWKYFDHAILFPLYPNPANPKFQMFQNLVQWSMPFPGSMSASQELLTELALKTMNKCSFCGQVSAALKKCARCHKVAYCGRECQLKHWPTHKSACNVSDTNLESSTPTQKGASGLPQTHSKTQSSNLNISSSSPVVQHTPLKQAPLHSETTARTLCTRCKKPANIECLCKSVSYCSKECRTLDWPDHEKKCNQPADDSSSVESHRTPLTIPSTLDREQTGDSGSRSTATAIEVRVCMRCKKPATINCSCELVWYCSNACQTLEWPEHSKRCTPSAKKLSKPSPLAQSSKGKEFGDLLQPSSLTPQTTGQSWSASVSKEVLVTSAGSTSDVVDDRAETVTQTVETVEEHMAVKMMGLSVADDARVPPPRGYIEPRHVEIFSRERLVNDTWTFYSIEHGVTISIHKDAVPPNMGTFGICMHAYLWGPFEIPEEYEICTAIFVIQMHPKFEFCKPVTLKIPHSVIFEDDDQPEDFVVLRAPEPAFSDAGTHIPKLSGTCSVIPPDTHIPSDPHSERHTASQIPSVYKFSDVISDADYSEDYYVQVDLDHFSAFAGAKRRHRHRLRKSTESEQTRFSQ